MANLSTLLPALPGEGGRRPDEGRDAQQRGLAAGTGASLCETPALIRPSGTFSHLAMGEG